MLHEFVTLHRDEIILRCRAKVSKRSIPPPTDAEINHGVPLFLEQLAHSLRLGEASNPEICVTAALHGHDLLLQGFTVGQVVHDYGDICQSITELAVELGAAIGAEEFRMLNKCLDDAIAGAVTEYGRARTRSDIDGELARGGIRLGFLAHELRNLTNTATFAFEALKSGDVGVAGSTGAVLSRSLAGLRALINRSLSEVRLTEGIQRPEQFPVAEFVAELAASTKLEADAKGVTLAVLPVDGGLAISADRQVLNSVMVNVLQNAFKFTRPATTVTLRVNTTDERVLIEVQDKCGGLPEDANELFRPFEQRGADRTGLGLGLSFCRWGVEANHGRIHARNVADGEGCVFTVELPRVLVGDVALSTA